MKSKIIAFLVSVLMFTAITETAIHTEGCNSTQLAAAKADLVKIKSYIDAYVPVVAAGALPIAEIGVGVLAASGKITPEEAAAIDAGLVAVANYLKKMGQTTTPATTVASTTEGSKAMQRALDPNLSAIAYAAASAQLNKGL